MKTSFHGNKVVFASAVMSIFISLISVVFSSQRKQTAQIKKWNAKYEYEKTQNEIKNEKQLNAVE